MNSFLTIFAALFGFAMASSSYASPSTSDVAAANYSGGTKETYGSTNSEVQNPNPDDQGGDGIHAVPGVAGVDYPAYRAVPKTAFSCEKLPQPGYYADPESDCQVFHVCRPDGSHISFLCPNGSMFNQQHFVCDWWYKVDCNQATSFYTLNNELYKEAPISYNDNKSGSSEKTGSKQSSSSGYSSNASGPAVTKANKPKPITTVAKKTSY